MRNLLRIIKLIPLILILFIVSAGYRLFSGKESEQKKSEFFDINTAQADVPPPPGCGDGGGGGGGSDDS